MPSIKAPARFDFAEYHPVHGSDDVRCAPRRSPFASILCGFPIGFALAAGLTLLFLSQSPADASAEVPYPITEHPDLRYFKGDPADADKHTLDLYLPEGRSNAPLLLWIHGGAWAVGDRSDEARMARQFASNGIGVAAINYRLSPATWMNPSLTTGVEHPAHIEDCARAFAWLHAQAPNYGYDPKQITVSGYSSGGHLSALLVTDPSYLKAEGMDVNDVHAAIPMAGAYDLESYYQDHLESNGREMAEGHVLGVFGPIGGLANASPTSHLDHATVPMLVISETDTFDFTALFESRAKESGRTEIEFLHVRNKDHTGLYFSLSDEENTTRDTMIAFLEKKRL